MNNSILQRLAKLEAKVPSDLIVRYEIGEESYESTVKEYARVCLDDGKMYPFHVVGGNRLEDVDILFPLFEDIDDTV